MRLTHPKALEQFLKVGVLATMRNYPYESGKTIRVRTPGGEYRARVIARREVTPEVVEAYVSFSGFGDANEWREAAAELHEGRLPRYVVLIVRTAEEHF